MGRLLKELSAAKIALAVEMLLNPRELALQDPDVVMAALENFRKSIDRGRNCP